MPTFIIVRTIFIYEDVYHQTPPGGMALDYISGNCFGITAAKPLPHDILCPDNDLNELIHKYVARAIAMENSAVYAFGEKWGPETKRDKYFGFKPGNGIHDIHANQGNSDAWKRDDGVYQDGGLIIHLPDEARWVAIFLAFQSQCFHTDDTTGHRIPGCFSRPDLGLVSDVLLTKVAVAPMTSTPGASASGVPVGVVEVRVTRISEEAALLNQTFIQPLPKKGHYGFRYRRSVREQRDRTETISRPNRCN